jgi:hypothetical protein
MCASGVATELPAELCDEADYLHRAMFRKPPEPAFVERYARAHAEILELRAISSVELRTLGIIVTRRLDPLAVEPWLRGRSRRHALSAKLALIAYLAECDGAHPMFVRRAPGRGVAWLGIVLSGGMGAARLVMGFVQWRRYGLL